MDLIRGARMNEKDMGLSENGIETFVKANVLGTVLAESIPPTQNNGLSFCPPKNENITKMKKSDKTELGDLGNNLTLRLKDNLVLPVVNYSPFGLAVQSKTLIDISSDEIRTKLFLRDSFVFDLNLRLIRSAGSFPKERLSSVLKSSESQFKLNTLVH